MNESSQPAPVLTEIPRYGYSPEPIPENQRIPALNVILFLLTLLTTTMAGAYMAGADSPLSNLSNLALGLMFSVPLMSILLVHELGHFIVSRYHRVNASWPYFIPAPFPSVFIVGTFGAFIRMKSPPRSRAAMFDVG